MDRGAWWATVHGVAETDMTEVLKPGPAGTLILSRPYLIPKTEGKQYNKEGAF